MGLGSARSNNTSNGRIGLGSSIGRFYPRCMDRRGTERFKTKKNRGSRGWNADFKEEKEANQNPQALVASCFLCVSVVNLPSHELDQLRRNILRRTDVKYGLACDWLQRHVGPTHLVNAIVHDHGISAVKELLR